MRTCRWPAVEPVHPWPILQVLVLLVLANGAPVAAKKVLGERFASPLDGGAVFADGRPLFGRSKTIRGIVLAVLATMLGAPLIGLEWQIGFLVGSLAMAGDLASSFLKRRMSLPPSSRASGLDQVPEALFPLLGCRNPLSLTSEDIAVGVALFFIGEILLSRVLYIFRLRDRPY
jgi:CDP-diglyceride synthetase